MTALELNIGRSESPSWSRTTPKISRNPFTLRDRNTGSVWNLNGDSVSGPLVGESLAKIPTFTSFWFAWSSFNAGSEIHGDGGN